jgi:DNA-binding FadR family transcriptional regulator
MDALDATEGSREFGGEHGFAVNKYHEDLHTRIAECARSQLLKSQIVKSLVLRVNSLFEVSSGWRRLPPGFHRDLINVIVKGDPQAAEDAMRQHVNYGLKAIQRTLEPLQRKAWRLKPESGRKKTCRFLEARG